MNEKIILAFAAIGLLLVAGCEGGSLFGKQQKEERPVTDADVRKGFSGLNMEFVQNVPPESVFEESDFQIAVNLKNEGASNIGDNSGVLVFGLENAYTDVAAGANAKQGFGVNGKSVYNLNGDKMFVELNAQTKKIGTQSEKHPSTIFATACYPYKTVLGTSVCIDPDVTGAATVKKVCEIKEMTFAEGQGAPVAITKIETRMLPDVDASHIKPHFIIFIENSGNGEVVNASKLDLACSSSALKYSDFNVLKITASLPQGTLNCGGEMDTEGFTTVRLREKEDMVRCTLEEGVGIGSGAYISPLRIELKYGYTFTISKSIIIEKVLTH